jgi:hypothetical protein
LSCPFAAAAPPKGAAKSKKEGGKLEEELDAVIQKTRPHQGERYRPRRERRWLWLVAPA